MLWILLALAIGSNKIDRAEVDLIELNHRGSEDGCLQFDQVIIWKWSPNYRRYDAQYWFIVNSLPGYPVQAGEFYQCYGCRPDQQRIMFRSKMFRETWTTDDPERENIKLFPIEMRSHCRSH